MVYPFAHTNPCPGAFQNAEVAQTRKMGSGKLLKQALDGFTKVGTGKGRED